MVPGAGKGMVPGAGTGMVSGAGTGMVPGGYRDGAGRGRNQTQDGYLPRTTCTASTGELDKCGRSPELLDSIY